MDSVFGLKKGILGGGQVGLHIMQPDWAEKQHCLKQLQVCRDRFERNSLYLKISELTRLCCSLYLCGNKQKKNYHSTYRSHFSLLIMQSSLQNIETANQYKIIPFFTRKLSLLVIYKIIALNYLHLKFAIKSF